MILLCDKLITSGLARCANSITPPLPNLVAKLAILLRSVLCGHNSAIQMKVVLIIFANPVLVLSIPSIHRCVFDIYVQTYIHLFGDSLCKANICHILPDVHCVFIGYPP